MLALLTCLLSLEAAESRAKVFWIQWPTVTKEVLPMRIGNDEAASRTISISRLLFRESFPDVDMIFGNNFAQLDMRLPATAAQMIAARRSEARGLKAGQALIAAGHVGHGERPSPVLLPTDLCSLHSSKVDRSSQVVHTSTLVRICCAHDTTTSSSLAPEAP
jgi:hypothetical protein